ESQTVREMHCGRSEDIAAMKSPARCFQEKGFVLDTADLKRTGRPDRPREYSIIRTDQDEIGGSNCNRLSGTSDTRIDNGDMNCSFGKVLAGGHQREGPGPNILGGNFVSDIDDFS